MMNERIKELITEVGTDVSGKWVTKDNTVRLAELLIREFESYIEESEGDIDYVRFLIDRNLK